MRTQGRYLTLEPVSNGINVRLTPEGVEELQNEKDVPDSSRFAELFDDFAGNGWSMVTAEQVGGLTGCEIIIAWDAVFDENNYYITEYCDALYWHERYAIEDAIEKLREGCLFLLKA